MASVGQRMLHHREVSVCALAACSSLAARAAGRFARSMPLKSVLYANVPLAVTIIRAAASSASVSEPESVSACHHFSSSNAGDTPLRSNSHVPSSPTHTDTPQRGRSPGSVSVSTGGVNNSAIRFARPARSCTLYHWQVFGERRHCPLNGSSPCLPRRLLLSHGALQHVPLKRPHDLPVCRGGRFPTNSYAHQPQQGKRARSGWVQSSSRSRNHHHLITFCWHHGIPFRRLSGKAVQGKVGFVMRPEPQ